MVHPKGCYVEKVSAAKACENLPNKKPWAKTDLEDIDLLIVAAGFEDRALAFPEEIADSDISVGSVFVGRYETNTKDNDEMYSLIKPALYAKTSSIIEANADSPSEILVAIRDVVSGWGDSQHIVFDISSASSPFICTVLGVISELKPSVKLTILYAEADSYAKPRDIESSPDKWTEEDIAETGISLVDVNPIFRGAHQENCLSFVVAFPGLSQSRLACCLNHFSEEFERFATRNVKWVIPVTDHEDHLWRRGKVEESILGLCGGESKPGANGGLRELVSEENVIECDNQTYTEAAKILLACASEKLGKNLGVIMLGSKLQTLGAALGLCVANEITSVYARPVKFDAKSYSSGIGRKWIISFPALSSSLSELRSCGSLILKLEDGSELC